MRRPWTSKILSFTIGLGVCLIVLSHLAFAISRKNWKNRKNDVKH